jgi:hypothetical protein
VNCLDRQEDIRPSIGSATQGRPEARNEICIDPLWKPIMTGLRGISRHGQVGFGLRRDTTSPELRHAFGTAWLTPGTSRQCFSHLAPGGRAGVLEGVTAHPVELETTDSS